MKKILVVRFKQIGDAILSSVICSSLKKTYPDSQIDYVVYDYVAPIFEKQPYIDNVISISKEERKDIFKYLNKAWKVTRNDYDIVIDIMSTPKSEVFTLFSRKAKFKIGREKKWRGYTYTHRIPEPPNTLDKAEKFLEMLCPIEKSGEKIVYDPNYYLEFSADEIKYLREKMLKAGIDFNKTIFAFAINSRREHKIYPVDLMLEVIKKTLEKYDCQIIFYYSPEEKAFAKDIHTKLANDPRIFSNIETESIRELGALIKNCDMFVGNEGGPRHLAQSVDVPSFAIFSPGSSKKDWLSKNNPRHQGIEPIEIGADNYDSLNYEEKYRLITPEIVMENVDRLLNKYVKKS